MENIATIGFKADTTGLKNAERGLDSLARKGEMSEKRLNRSVDNTNKSFNTLKATIGAAGVALAGLGGIRLSSEITKQSDAWKNISSQIRQVTQSEKDLIAVRTKLLTLSKDTRSDLTNTVDLYATLTRSTKDLGTTQGEVLGVTKTLNNLFVAGGKPISEVAGAIRQLNQGFAAGALRGDEFNSVAEGAPKIMDALSSKLKMTRGELREFAATGGITAQIMIDALKDYEQVAEKLANQTTKTFGQAMENATTNITEFVGEAKVLNDMVDSLGGGIEGFTGELGGFSREVGLWGEQWSVWGDDAEKAMTSTSDVFRLEMLALESITEETMIFMGGAILEFPSNIRAMTKILGVELGFAIDMIVQHSKLIVNSIKAPFVNIPTIVKTYIQAFGNVLGTQLAAIVEKTKIYGLQIKDALNPFDGDTFDHSAALRSAEELARKLTNQYLQAADDQVSSAENARDASINAANETAEARILASENARASVISDILAERDATLLVYKKIETSAEVASKSRVTASSKRQAEFKKESEKFTKENEEMMKRIDSAFSDVWYNIIDGSGNVFDSVIDGFKRMLAEMAHAAITRPIVMQITSALGLSGAGGMVGGIGGALGGLLGVGGMVGGSAAGGALGGLGQLAGGATALSSMGLLGGAFGAGVGGTSALLGAGSLTGALANTGALFGSGSIMAGIGSLMPMIAGITAIAGIADSITGGGLFGTSYKTTGQDLTLGTSGGDISGFTSLTEKKKRSLFRGSKTRTTDTNFDTSAIQDIFTDLELSILDAAQRLDITEASRTVTSSFSKAFDDRFNGSILEALTSTVTMPVDEWLNSFSSVLKIDTENLSEEEIQAKINEWVQQTTDSMINGVFGDLVAEFEKEGESSMQVVDRLISNMTTFGSVANTLGLNFSLVGTEAARAATNIVDMVGGLGSLNSLTSQYYSEFFSAQEQFDNLTSGLVSSFESLGLAIPETRDEFRSLVESLDLSTEAGQEMFAMLMQLVPGMSAYFDELEKVDDVIGSYTNSLNEAMSALKESVKAEKQRAVDVLNVSKEIYDAEIKRISAQREAIIEQEALAQQGLQSTLTALDKSFTAERDAINNKSSIEQQAIKDRLSSELLAIKDKLSVEKSALKQASDIRADGLKQEIDLLSDRRSGLNATINSMSSLASKLTGSAIGNSSNDIASALAAARKGSFDKAQGLSGDLPIANKFSSASEFKAAESIAKNQLMSIAKLATNEASQAEMQLSALESMAESLALQIESEKSDTERLIEALESQSDKDIETAKSLAESQSTKSLEITNAQLTALDNQYNTLLGIDTTILSLSEASKAYQDAKLQADSLHTEEMLQKLDDEFDIANQALELAQKAYDDEILRLDQVLINAQNQIDVLMGIDINILSVVDAINNLNTIISNPPPAPTPVAPAPVVEDPKTTEANKRQEKINASMLDTLNKQTILLRKIELNGATA